MEKRPGQCRRRPDGNPLPKLRDEKHDSEGLRSDFWHPTMRAKEGQRYHEADHSSIEKVLLGSRKYKDYNQVAWQCGELDKFLQTIPLLRKTLSPFHKDRHRCQLLGRWVSRPRMVWLCRIKTFHPAQLIVQAARDLRDQGLPQLL